MVAHTHDWLVMSNTQVPFWTFEQSLSSRQPSLAV
jgi:hypothetical protein